MYRDTSEHVFSTLLAIEIVTEEPLNNEFL